MNSLPTNTLSATGFSATRLPAKSLLSCAIVFALLQGCGGGGGGGGDSAPASSSSSSAPSVGALTPAAPSPSINFAIKQLRFSWSAVDGATFYRVLEDANGSGTYTQVGGDLTALTYSHDIAVHTQNWSAARYLVQACNSNGCTSSNMLSASSGVLQAIGYFKASNASAGDTFGWTIALSDDGTTLAVGAPSEDSSATGINGSQSSDATTDSGAVYVFVNTGSGWTQQAYLKASNTYAGDNFGESVALSSDGNTLAVGAPFEDSSATTINGSQTTRTAGDAGSIYVFTRSGSSWSQQAYVKPTNTYAASYFGWSVALSDDGNTLAAGAPGESNSNSGVNPGANTHSASNAGAAYVFTRSGSNWSQQVYLKASNAAAEDNFGTAIALNGSGSTLAVGSPYEASAATGINGTQSDNSATTAGAAYVFTRSGSTWSQQAYVKASNTGAGDNFGAQLALDNSGNTLAVGAPYEASSATGVGGTQSNNSAANAGAAYVFARSGSSWSQQAYVKASNTNTNDNFASALALSSDGSTLAVGAIGESSSATGINGSQSDNSKDGVGAVYLFTRSGTAWSQQTYVKPSTSTVGNEFGTAIGLSANAGTLAISGAFEQSNATGIGGTQTNTSATDAGAVWMF
ncbi:MAG: histidine kinase [Spongiibacteraceae bacterium]